MDTDARQRQAGLEQRKENHGALGLLFVLVTAIAFHWIMLVVALWDVQDLVQFTEGWLASHEPYASSVGHLEGVFSSIRNEAAALVFPTICLLGSYVIIYRLFRDRRGTSTKDS